MSTATNPHSHAANRVAQAKRRIASDQAYDEGNYRPNSDRAPELCFTKSLPHDGSGRVDGGAWYALQDAVQSRDASAWASVPMGTCDGSRLANPMAAWSFDLEGPAYCSVGLPSAPEVSSPEAAADLLEDYEHYLMRDIPFTEYENSTKARRSARRMSRLSSFLGPTQQGRVTPSVLFRGNTRGDLTGPYLSQFLLLPFDIINANFDQKYRFPAPGTDFMSTWKTALACQNGQVLEKAPRLSKVPRHIRTGRDLAWYVHDDWSYEAYLHAALVMQRLGVPFNRTNPYANGSIPNQSGFVTFGFPDVADMIARASTSALRAAWYHKWLIHQKLRPEAMAMIVDQILQTDENPQNIHEDLIESKTMNAVYRKNTTTNNKRENNLLLPQAYPEGSPTHPSYPAGHSTIAAACATILKAMYDETWQFPQAYQPDEDGLDLVEVDTPRPLTVRDELDKLVSNISIGRNFAGVHYRSDAMAGWDLGEKVAIRLLQDLAQRYTEQDVQFRFHLRDGSEIIIG